MLSVIIIVLLVVFLAETIPFIASVLHGIVNVN